MPDAGSDSSVTLSHLYRELDEQHIAPFWAVDASADHDEDDQVRDKAKAIPFIWKYEKVLEPVLSIVKNESEHKHP